MFLRPWPLKENAQFKITIKHLDMLKGEPRQDEVGEEIFIISTIRYGEFCLI